MARRLKRPATEFRESSMMQPPSVADSEQVVDTMIALTRLSNAHRTIIAGNDSVRLYVSLKRRGFIRVATPATCNIPRKQHSVGLVAGQDSPTTIEASLTEISPFLGDCAAIAILISSRESGLGPKIRTKLQQMGFRIEAGVRCDQGLVLSAYRQGSAQTEHAA
jgi:hypothetical protein